MKMNCASIRSLLPLSAGEDLDPRDREPLADHLRGCRSCRAEAAEYRETMAALRGKYTERYQLPPMARNRIAIEAAEKARQGGWMARFPIIAPTRSAGLLAAATAALVALVALPIGHRNGGGADSHDHSMTIEVRTVEPGKVRLAWSNGTRDAYTVYKSHDPRRLSHAEAHEVDGTIWTDTDSESAPIVYYRIE